MTVSSLKDLKKLLELCRSQGVKTLEVDGIKFELNEQIQSFKPASKRKLKEVSESVNFPPNSGVDENIVIPRMDIPDDGLTADELLFYSSDAREPVA